VAGLLWWVLIEQVAQPISGVLTCGSAPRLA
jgi:hypothetical protein